MSFDHLMLELVMACFFLPSPVNSDPKILISPFKAVSFPLLSIKVSETRREFASFVNDNTTGLLKVELVMKKEYRL